MFVDVAAIGSSRQGAWSSVSGSSSSLVREKQPQPAKRVRPLLCAHT